MVKSPFEHQNLQWQLFDWNDPPHPPIWNEAEFTMPDFCNGYCLWYFYFIWLTTFLCGRKGIRAIGKRCQSCVEAISTLFQFLDTLFLIALTSSPHILQRKKMDSKSFTRINTCRRPIWWIFFKAVKCWKGGFPFEEKRGKSNKSCRPKERSRQRVWPRSHQTNV